MAYDIPKDDRYVDSTADGRTVNNSDNAVRHAYRVLSDEEKTQMAQIKDLGLAFLTACDTIGQSRELSIAKTNIEQAVMWAVKSITK